MTAGEGGSEAARKDPDATLPPRIVYMYRIFVLFEGGREAKQAQDLLHRSDRAAPYRTVRLADGGEDRRTWTTAETVRLGEAIRCSG